MSKLRNLSVRSRFHLVMALVSASLVVLGVWGLLGNQAGADPIGRLFDQAAAASDEVGNLRESLSSLRRYESSMIAVAVSNPTDAERLHAAWKKELDSLNAGGERLAEANAADASIPALVATQKKLLGEYAAVISPIATQLQQATMDASAALAYAGRAEDTLAALQANTVALLKAQQANSAALRTEMAERTQLAALARLGLVGITLALFLPLMWLTLRSVCGPLDRAVAVASGIARGDLSETIVVQGKDEPARLLQALADMQQALRRLVGQVRDASGNIQMASGEVASGNQDLSHRTEQAASSLQETASAMEELTGTVKQSADSAHTANRLADSACTVAQRGGEVVSQVVATMDEIHASSKQIADIIGTIDGIAFQTNILALNAAVEAARAGEQGRGFAVVASEVRLLAQRSADAARQIKTLIGASVERVDAGSKLVRDAGSTMNEIVASVQRVAHIIGEITAATSEQSQGLAQINGAVTQLDQMTQQNSALVEQSAAAAESLREQADRLARVVATFRLGGEPAAHHVAAQGAIARAKALPAMPIAANEYHHCETF
jgi:methyl-accepting chemotaxis protein